MPRKSDAAKAADAAAGTANGPAAPEASTSSNGLDAYEMPKTTVMRITKSALPENAKLGKEIPSAMQKAATVFISYLSAHAQEIAADKKQKTLSAAHVMEAIRQLHWPDNKELEREMQKELEMFQSLPSIKRKEAKARKKAAEEATANGAPAPAKPKPAKAATKSAAPSAPVDPSAMDEDRPAGAPGDDPDATESDEPDEGGEEEEEEDEEPEELAEPDVEDRGLGDDDVRMEE